jgi:Plasmid pRiA4b ORF-3-like protein
MGYLQALRRNRRQTALLPSGQRAGARPKSSWSWQLKVELLDVSPIVWRRLTVPATITLPPLHQILQVVLGWTDSHLHQFVIARVSYSNAEEPQELDHRNERGVALGKAVGMDARCFDYVYDFGDDWHHVIAVEEQRPRVDPSSTLVHCSDGANACPPEDVDGHHGYAAALADHNHNEHQRYLEWVGGPFDPRRFDIDAVNLALSKIKS